MRVLVCGAHGFLGSHIAAALVTAGHDVVGAGRDLAFARRILPQIAWIECDFNRDLTPEVWLPRLAGIDAVVNAVGVLQTTRRDRLGRIHVDTPVAMMRACERAGVRRFVQVSALGIENADTDYARTKRAGDSALAESGLDWVVLRASLVVGRGSYGGTALMRGLAGLPGIIPLIADGCHEFQPILMRDFTRAVVDMLAPGAPSRATVPVAGPDMMTLNEIVCVLRQWLGFPSARTLAVPASWLRLAARFGDLLGWIGVPTAFRSTSIAQMEAGCIVADADRSNRIPVDAAPFRTGLFGDPATVEDRWHARLYFLKPLLRTILGLSWLTDGTRGAYLSFSTLAQASPPVEIGDVRVSIGLAIWFVDLAVHIGAGAAFLLRRFVGIAGIAMLALIAVNVSMSLAFSGFGVLLSEHLWSWLFGIWRPIFMATAILVVLAIERER